MPRRLKEPIDFHQQRFMQISESHCGPAVIQMLLSNLGTEVTQEQVAEAGGATSLIALHGMRVDQLARAVHRLAPDLLFYVKDHSKVEELIRIVHGYHYPVGVEWQGVFEDEDAAMFDRANKNWSPAVATELKDILTDSESQDTDYGHYSLVTRADRRRRELIIADPYKDFFSQARIFDFDVFDRRWYDFNEVPHTENGQSEIIKDDHLMFIVVRRNIMFPRRMGMREY